LASIFAIITFNLGLVGFSFSSLFFSFITAGFSLLLPPFPFSGFDGTPAVFIISLGFSLAASLITSAITSFFNVLLL